MVKPIHHYYIFKLLMLKIFRARHVQCGIQNEIWQEIFLNGPPPSPLLYL